MTRKRPPQKLHYSLMHELLASDTQPMPAHNRRHRRHRQSHRH